MKVRSFGLPKFRFFSDSVLYLVSDFGSETTAGKTLFRRCLDCKLHQNFEGEKAKLQPRTELQMGYTIK
jgi:hypothetical protein